MINYLRSTSSDPNITVEERPVQNSWIRSERPTADEQDILLSLGIDRDILTDALDPHEVPRLEFESGWSYFITRVPDIGDDFNDFTTPMLFAFNGDYFVTVSRDALGRLWQPFIEKTNVPTGQQKRLFLLMIDAIAQSYQNRVSMINRQMRAVSTDIARIKPRDIATIVEHERKLNDYLDALIPTNTALEKLLNNKQLRFRDDDLDEIEDLSVDVEQVITRCKSLLRTITNVRDSYRAVMDTRLNETMRILTVATLSLTIPTMLAGLFGMNVKFPFNPESSTVFWEIILVSVLAAFLISYYFLRKR